MDVLAEGLAAGKSPEEILASWYEYDLSKHLPGQHDQSSHGNWARGRGGADLFADLYGGPIDDRDLWRVMGAPESGQGLQLRADDEGRPVVQRTERNRFGNREVVESHPPEHLFRVVSESDYQRIVEQGYIDTSGEWNLSPDEGTNASWDSTGTFYMPQSGPSRIIRIDYRPEDGWLVDTADYYVKTQQRVPADRISLVSPVIDARIEAERHSMAEEHPDLWGNTGYRRTNRYLLGPGEEPAEGPFLLTHGDVRRALGDDYMGSFEIDPEEFVTLPDGRIVPIAKHQPGGHGQQSHGNWARGRRYRRVGWGDEAEGKRMLSQPLDEFVPDVIAAYQRRHGVDIELVMSERQGGWVELARIVVPEDYRGRGIGDSVLGDVLDWADEHQVTLGLDPADIETGTSVARLRRWYSRRGFVSNLGRRRDHRIMSSMRREPEPLDGVK